MIDPFSLSIGAAIALIGGPAIKTAIVAIWPQTATIFASIDMGQQQLLKIINATNDYLNKNSDLKEYAKANGLKIAEKLIDENFDH